MNGTTGSSLRTVKAVHTAVWAFFASCIVAVPLLALAGRVTAAGTLIGIVFIEVVVLMLNGFRCPLTDVAARFTADRRDNFDIYLPEWLARHNKTIFGSAYLAGCIVTFLCWLQK